jgi:hypothetical protein
VPLPNSDSSKKPGGPYRKPRADVYTLLLIFALIAVITATVLLYIQMGEYDYDMKGGPTVWRDVPPAVAATDCPWTHANGWPAAGLG